MSGPLRLILFDVDGTLAVPAQLAMPEVPQMLAKLREQYCVGIVGAGDFGKQQRQLGGYDMRKQFDFVFSENGVHAFRDGQLGIQLSILHASSGSYYTNFLQAP